MSITQGSYASRLNINTLNITDNQNRFFYINNNTLVTDPINTVDYNHVPNILGWDTAPLYTRTVYTLVLVFDGLIGSSSIVSLTNATLNSHTITANQIVLSIETTTSTLFTINIETYNKNNNLSTMRTLNTTLTSLSITPTNWIGVTPDIYNHVYTGLVLGFTTPLQIGGTPTTITASSGSNPTNITVDGNGNLVFDWITPVTSGQVTLTFNNLYDGVSYADTSNLVINLINSNMFNYWINSPTSQAYPYNDLLVSVNSDVSKIEVVDSITDELIETIIDYNIWGKDVIAFNMKETNTNKVKFKFDNDSTSTVNLFEPPKYPSFIDKNVIKFDKKIKSIKKINDIPFSVYNGLLYIEDNNDDIFYIEDTASYDGGVNKLEIMKANIKIINIITDDLYIQNNTITVEFDTEIISNKLTYAKTSKESLCLNYRYNKNKLTFDFIPEETGDHILTLHNVTHNNYSFYNTENNVITVKEKLKFIRWINEPKSKNWNHSVSMEFNNELKNPIIHTDLEQHVTDIVINKNILEFKWNIPKNPNVNPAKLTVDDVEILVEFVDPPSQSYILEDNLIRLDKDIVSVDRIEGGKITGIVNGCIELCSNTSNKNDIMLYNITTSEGGKLECLCLNENTETEKIQENKLEIVKWFERYNTITVEFNKNIKPKIISNNKISNIYSNDNTLDFLCEINNTKLIYNNNNFDVKNIYNNVIYFKHNNEYTSITISEKLRFVKWSSYPTIETNNLIMEFNKNIKKIGEINVEHYEINNNKLSINVNTKKPLSKKLLYVIYISDIVTEDNEYTSLEIPVKQEILTKIENILYKSIDNILDIKADNIISENGTIKREDDKYIYYCDKNNDTLTLYNVYQDDVIIDNEVKTVKLYNKPLIINREIILNRNEYYEKVKLTLRDNVNIIINNNIIECINNEVYISIQTKNENERIKINIYNDNYYPEEFITIIVVDPPDNGIWFTEDLIRFNKDIKSVDLYETLNGMIVIKDKQQKVINLRNIVSEDGGVLKSYDLDRQPNVTINKLYLNNYFYLCTMNNQICLKNIRDEFKAISNFQYKSIDNIIIKPIIDEILIDNLQFNNNTIKINNDKLYFNKTIITELNKNGFYGCKYLQTILDVNRVYFGNTGIYITVNNNELIFGNSNEEYNYTQQIHNNKIQNDIFYDNKYTKKIDKQIILDKYTMIMLCEKIKYNDDDINLCVLTVDNNYINFKINDKKIEIYNNQIWKELIEIESQITKIYNKKMANFELENIIKEIQETYNINPPKDAFWIKEPLMNELVKVEVGFNKRIKSVDNIIPKVDNIEIDGNLKFLHKMDVDTVYKFINITAEDNSISSELVLYPPIYPKKIIKPNYIINKRTIIEVLCSDSIDKNSNITIDNNECNIIEYGTIIKIEIELKPGIHRLKINNSVLEFEVHLGIEIVQWITKPISKGWHYTGTTSAQLELSEELVRLPRIQVNNKEVVNKKINKNIVIFDANLSDNNNIEIKIDVTTENYSDNLFISYKLIEPNTNYEWLYRPLYNTNGIIQFEDNIISVNAPDILDIREKKIIYKNNKKDFIIRDILFENGGRIKTLKIESGIISRDIYYNINEIRRICDNFTGIYVYKKVISNSMEFKVFNNTYVFPENIKIYQMMILNYTPNENEINDYYYHVSDNYNKIIFKEWIDNNKFKVTKYNYLLDNEYSCVLSENTEDDIIIQNDIITLNTNKSEVTVTEEINNTTHKVIVGIYPIEYICDTALIINNKTKVTVKFSNKIIGFNNNIVNNNHKISVDKIYNNIISLYITCNTIGDFDIIFNGIRCVNGIISNGSKITLTCVDDIKLLGWLDVPICCGYNYDAVAKLSNELTKPPRITINDENITGVNNNNFIIFNYVPQNNTNKLYITFSDLVTKYGKMNSISTYIDTITMKNKFIIDGNKITCTDDIEKVIISFIDYKQVNNEIYIIDNVDYVTIDKIYFKNMTRGNNITLKMKLEVVNIKPFYIARGKLHNNVEITFSSSINSIENSMHMNNIIINNNIMKFDLLTSNGTLKLSNIKCEHIIYKELEVQLNIIDPLNIYEVKNWINPPLLKNKSYKTGACSNYKLKSCKCKINNKETDVTLDNFHIMFDVNTYDIDRLEIVFYDMVTEYDTKTKQYFVIDMLDEGIIKWEKLNYKQYYKKYKLFMPYDVKHVSRITYNNQDNIETDIDYKIFGDILVINSELDFELYMENNENKYFVTLYGIEYTNGMCIDECKIITNYTPQISPTTIICDEETLITLEYNKNISKSNPYIFTYDNGEIKDIKIHNNKIKFKLTGHELDRVRIIVRDIIDEDGYEDVHERLLEINTIMRTSIKSWNNKPDKNIIYDKIEVEFTNPIINVSDIIVNNNDMCICSGNNINIINNILVFGIDLSRCEKNNKLQIVFKDVIDNHRFVNDIKCDIELKSDEYYIVEWNNKPVTKNTIYDSIYMVEAIFNKPIDKNIDNTFIKNNNTLSFNYETGDEEEIIVDFGFMKERIKLTDKPEVIETDISVNENKRNITYTIIFNKNIRSVPCVTCNYNNKDTKILDKIINNNKVTLNLEYYNKISKLNIKLRKVIGDDDSLNKEIDLEYKDTNIELIFNNKSHVYLRNDNTIIDQWNDVLNDNIYFKKLKQEDKFVLHSNDMKGININGTMRLLNTIELPNNFDIYIVMYNEMSNFKILSNPKPLLLFSKDKSLTSFISVDNKCIQYDQINKLRDSTLYVPENQTIIMNIKCINNNIQTIIYTRTNVAYGTLVNYNNSIDSQTLIGLNKCSNKTIIYEFRIYGENKNYISEELYNRWLRPPKLTGITKTDNYVLHFNKPIMDIGLLRVNGQKFTEYTKLNNKLVLNNVNNSVINIQELKSDDNGLNNEIIVSTKRNKFIRFDKLISLNKNTNYKCVLVFENSIRTNNGYVPKVSCYYNDKLLYNIKSSTIDDDNNISIEWKTPKYNKCKLVISNMHNGYYLYIEEVIDLVFG